MKYIIQSITILLFIFFDFEVSSQTEDEVTQQNLKAFELKDTDLNKAFELSDDVIAHIGIVKKEIAVSDIYSVRGTLYQFREEYTKAIWYHFKALRIRERLNNTPKIATSNLNIANAYYEIGDLELSLKYHLDCQQLLKENPEDSNYQDRLKNFNSLGTIYHSMEKTDSAYYFFNQSLYIIKKYNLSEPIAVSDLYTNIGILCEDQNKLPEAFEYFKKAEAIQLKNKEVYGLSLTYHHIGIVYERWKDLVKAKSYYNKALKLAQKLDDSEAKRDLFGSFTKLYNIENNGDSSNYYFDLYLQYNDIVQKAVNDKKIRETAAKYQLEKKEIELLNSKNRNSLLTYGYFIIGFTFILFLFFLIRNYRQKQRISRMQLDLKNREIGDLLNQQETASYAAMLEGQDQERLRIARELHDRLGSTLAAVKLGIQGNPTTTYKQNLELVDNAIAEIRAVSHDLSGGNIERYGLLAALTELKHTLERSGNIAFDLYMEAMTLPSSLQVPLYRIVQELVSNTLKHANASSIILQISEQQDHLNIIYEDNGRGFDLKNTTLGMGLENIRHRLSKWDGILEIDTHPGRGTIVIISIPHKTHYHD